MYWSLEIEMYWSLENRPESPKHSLEFETGSTRHNNRTFGQFVVIGESNPLLTKHLEQYESWSEKCYFWRNVNPKTKSEAKNITFCAEDDILAIQMLRQECGVSSEKIRQRADVRDVVACHASLVLTRKGFDLRLVCLCDASSASRLVRFDRRHVVLCRVTQVYFRGEKVTVLWPRDLSSMSGRDRKLEAKRRRSLWPRDLSSMSGRDRKLEVKMIFVARYVWSVSTVVTQAKRRRSVWPRDLSSWREIWKGDDLCDLGTLVAWKICENGDGLCDLGTCVAREKCEKETVCVTSRDRKREIR